MKLLILGTSNSLLRGGYVDGIREALPDAAITNRSVGASPGAQFACAMPDDLSGYDAVIFDSVVNDENIEPFVGTPDYFAALMRRMLSTVAAQAPLVVLGFCNRRYFRTPSAIYELHRTIAEELGAPFMSARDFALARGQDILGPGVPLFEETTHIDRRISFVFGHDLAGKLGRIERRPGVRNYAHEFARIDATREGRTYVKANSLFGGWRFRALAEGDEIRLDRDRDLVGMYIDANGTRGALACYGNASTRCKSLLYHVTEKSLVKFVPFHNGVRCHGLAVTPAVAGCEASPHEAVEGPEIPPRAAIAMLASWTPGA
jgi:hypothetical protein